MSKTVDTKVVEMQFDNKNFEKNVGESLDTLDKLKEKLNFERDVKGLEELDRASRDISFDQMANSVAMLEQRFSTMGIVGMRVIQNLTDSMMNFAYKTIGFLTSGVLQGGFTRAMNLENAHFQMEGLIKDETEVAKIMENVNDSVAGTAYSLDAAALVASQLAASGMRGGDELLSVLRAVTGVAAMTNSEYQQIGDIFTTVAGNGRLMSMQLLQLSGRGLNAAATLAEYLTKIGDGAKVTEADVRDMVSKGKIDFLTFAKAMDDAFGEHAFKANETYTGAMANTRAALAKIGAEFYGPLIQKNGPLVSFFNNVREQINDVKEAIIPLVKILSESVANAILKVAKLVKKIDFSKLAMSEKALNNFKDSLEGIHSLFSLVGKAVGSLFSIIGHYLPSFQKFRDGTLSVTGGLGRWLTKLNETADETNFFGKIVEKVTGFLDGLLVPLKKVKEKISEKILPKGYQKFLDVLDSIFDRLSVVKDILGRVKDATVDLFKTIRDKFMEFKLTSLFDGLSNVISSLGDGLAKIVKAFGETFTNVITGDNVAGIMSIIRTFSMGEMARGVLNFSDYFGKAFGVGAGSNKKIGIVDALANVLGKNSWVTVLDELRWTLVKFKKSIEADTLMKIAKAISLLAGSLIVLAMVDSDRLNAASGAIVTLTFALVGALRILDTFSTTFSSLLNLPVIAGSLIPLAGAVVILAFALKKVADIDDKKLGNAFAAIGGLMGLLTAMTKWMQHGYLKVLSKQVKIFPKFPHFGMDMTLLATGVFILAKAMKEIADVDSKKIGGVFIAIETMVMTLAGAAKWLGKGFGKDSVFPKVGMQMIFLSTAVLILTKSMEPLAKLNTQDLVKSVGAISILMLGLTGAMSNLRGMNIPKAGFQIVLLSGAVSALVGMMQVMKGMETQDVVKSVGAIDILMFSLVQSISLLNGIKMNKRVPKQLIAISGALAILVGLAKVLSDFSGEELGKAGIALFGAVGILAVAINQLNAMPNVRGLSPKLLALGGAIMMLSLSLKVLSSIPFLGAITAIGLLAGSIFVLSTTAVALKGLSASLIAVSASVALFGVGLAGIGAGMMGFGAGVAALAGLTTSAFVAIAMGIETILKKVVTLIPNILVALGKGLVEMIKVFGEAASELGTAIKNILLAAIDMLREVIPELTESFLVIFTEVFKSLTKYGPDLVKNIAEFLLSIFDSLTEYLPKLSKKAVEVFVIFFESMGDAVMNMNPDTLLKTILGVGLLGGLMLGISALRHLVPGAMVGAIAVTLFIGELSVLIAAIGALSKLPGLKWLVDEGGDFLASVGAAIGKFIGGFVGGITKGFTSQLTGIADDLSEFMEHIKPFLDGATNIDASSLDGIDRLTKIIRSITGDALLEGITRFITGRSSVEIFAEMLQPLGEGIANFSASVSGKIDSDAITAAANAGKILAELDKTLPRTGGLWGAIAGDRQSIEEFASGLEVLGDGIAAFSTAVVDGGGIDTTAVEAAATVGKTLSELNNNLPRTEGLWGLLAGDRATISDFADNLEPLGKGISAFAKSVSGDVNLDTASKAAAVGKTLAELNNSLPKEDGEWQFWAGHRKDLEAFGDEVPKLGKGISDFAESISGITNTDAMNNVVSSAKLIAGIYEMMPEVNGIMTIFTGDQFTFEDFELDLSRLGSGLSLFSQSIVGVDATGISNILPPLQTLATIVKLISDMDIDVRCVASFSKSISDLGKNVNDYYISIQDIDQGKLNSMCMTMSSLVSMVTNISNAGTQSTSEFMSNLQNLVTNTIPQFMNSADGMAEQSKSIGIRIINNMKEGVTLNSKPLIQAFTDLMHNCNTEVLRKIPEFEKSMDKILKGMQKKIDGKKSSFNKSGSKLMDHFVNGIKSKKSTITSQLGVILTECTSTIDGYYNSFYNSGTYLVKGFANAIRDNKWRAVNNARDMTKAALEEVKKAQREGSPSKITYKSGTFFAFGFINAIKDHIRDARYAASEFTNEAVEGLNEAIAMIGDYIDDSPMLEPVIRPILDTTNIDNFKGIKPIAVDASLGKANAIMAIQNQKSNQNDGVSENVSNQTFTFTQNNYSPKALSSLDIYRRTNNQFNNFERRLRRR